MADLVNPETPDRTGAEGRVRRLGIVVGVALVTALWITGGVVINTWWAQFWPALAMFAAFGGLMLRQIARWVWHG